MWQVYIYQKRKRLTTNKACKERCQLGSVTIVKVVFTKARYHKYFHYSIENCSMDKLCMFIVIEWEL